MQKLLTHIPKFFLLTILLTSACAPAATPPPIAESAPSATLASAPIAGSPTPSLILPEATQPPAPTLGVIFPEATSRGPNLEASDPTTVNLASGQLQLVEFFRFT